MIEEKLVLVLSAVIFTVGVVGILIFTDPGVKVTRTDALIGLLILTQVLRMTVDGLR